MPYRDIELQRAANRKHYRENKQQYVARSRRLKADTKAMILAAKVVPCLDCGKTYPFYVMDLDHRDRTRKKFEIAVGHARRYSRKAMREEIEKCDAVCANCHRVRTYRHLVLVDQSDRS